MVVLKGEDQQTISGDRKVEVQGNDFQAVALTSHTRVGMVMAVEAGVHAHFKAGATLVVDGGPLLTPLAGVAGNSEAIQQAIAGFDWQTVDLVHAELGGGRLGEFLALRELRKAYPQLPLTATVHDPERIVWRREHLPFPLNLLERLPSPLPQAAVVLADPLTLREERQVAKGLTRLVTLTRLGADCLSQRMQLPAGKVAVINHANLAIAPVPLPSLDTLHLLYFGFIYRGKGIEDLVQALAQVFKQAPELRGRVRLTLAGGTAAEMAFGAGGNYLEQLNAQIAALGLSDAIDWRLNLPADDIAQTIQAHHVMVLPYRESKKLGLLGRQRGTSGALSWATARGRVCITGLCCSPHRPSVWMRDLSGTATTSTFSP